MVSKIRNESIHPWSRATVHSENPFKLVSHMKIPYVKGRSKGGSKVKPETI
jgi:hypothetical protein